MSCHPSAHGCVCRMDPGFRCGEGHCVLSGDGQPDSRPKGVLSCGKEHKPPVVDFLPVFDSVPDVIGGVKNACLFQTVRENRHHHGGRAVRLRRFREALAHCVTSSWTLSYCSSNRTSASLATPRCAFRSVIKLLNPLMVSELISAMEPERSTMQTISDRALFILPSFLRVTERSVR